MKKVLKGWFWTWLLLASIIIANANYSRKRGHKYRNSLMRMQYHAWDFGDVLDTVLSFLKNLLVPNYGPQSRISEFLFFFDFNNNGSSPFLGLSISQRDAAYVSYFHVLLRRYILPPKNYQIQNQLKLQFSPQKCKRHKVLNLGMKFFWHA